MHRAFDRDTTATSIWYVQNLAGKEFRETLASTNIALDRLEELAVKLKPFRDQVHFHADRRVLDIPSGPWQRAGLTGDEFNELTESAHELLRVLKLKLKMTGIDSVIPSYSGNDIEFILRAYVEKYPNADVSF